MASVDSSNPNPPLRSRELHFPDSRQLSNLYGNRIQSLKLIEKVLNIELITRDNWVKINGEPPNVERTVALFEILQSAHKHGFQVKPSDLQYLLTALKNGHETELRNLFDSPLVLEIGASRIIPKTLNQKRYLHLLTHYDLVFGIGTAGVGKTYLAMAAALYALFQNQVHKIIITRPAVEAGEALGYLPGDLQEKVLPYLRPLYDALYHILGKSDAERLIAKGSIEIAPLAYMRGRTLSNAFIILDEAQNTTPQQILLFLTRLGDGSRMAVNGDITQIDLPPSTPSGLRQALETLAPLKAEIPFFHFDNSDSVRHPLVQKIIEAYQRRSAPHS